MQTIDHSHYQQHPNSIHELAITNAKPQAVLHYMDVMQSTAHRDPKCGMILILLDLRSAGRMPVAQLQHEIARFNASRLTRPPSRTGVLYGHTAMLRPAISTSRLLARPGLDEFKFFHGDQRSNAMAWLLSFRCM